MALIGAGIRRSERRARALELLAEVGLVDRAEHLPAELSGGDFCLGVAENPDHKDKPYFIERSRIDQAIEAVDATAYADRGIGQVSGGERQRLLLAQALVGAPELLLLDEPLANLDVAKQSAMAELVARVARDRDMTVVLVAHDLNPLRRVVDRVCYVAGGGVLIGSPEEVVTGPVLSRLYGAPVEVLIDNAGRRFVVGLEEEAAHPHGGEHAGHDHHVESH